MFNFKTFSLCSVVLIAAAAATTSYADSNCDSYNNTKVKNQCLTLQQTTQKARDDYKNRISQSMAKVEANKIATPSLKSSAAPAPVPAPAPANLNPQTAVQPEQTNTTESVSVQPTAQPATDTSAPQNNSNTGAQPQTNQNINKSLKYYY